MKEFRLKVDAPEGEINLSVTQFQPGDFVDVIGRSKGKGFQGMVKRHRFSRGPESHGSMNVRQPGSIGATDAARVFKGVKMAGQMGNRRITVQGLKVIRVDGERNLLGGSRPIYREPAGLDRSGNADQPAESDVSGNPNRCLSQPFS